MPNDLPGLDLHAFAVDPADPDHAWTFAVGFGLYETTDAGRRWALRQPGNWGYLATYRDSDRNVLIAVRLRDPLEDHPFISTPSVRFGQPARRDQRGGASIVCGLSRFTLCARCVAWSASARTSKPRLRADSEFTSSSKLLT